MLIFLIYYRADILLDGAAAGLLLVEEEIIQRAGELSPVPARLYLGAERYRPVYFRIASTGSIRAP